MASEMGLLPGIGYIGLSSFRDEQALGLYDNYIQIAIHGLSSMSFLLPYILAMLVTYRGSEKSARIWRVLLWIALLFGISLMLISAARALVSHNTGAVVDLRFLFFPARCPTDSESEICPSSGRGCTLWRDSSDVRNKFNARSEASADLWRTSR